MESNFMVANFDKILSESLGHGIMINDYYVETIFWNIFLAVIPVLLILYLAELYKKNKFKKLKQKIYAYFLFFIWLIFLPNAAYIITDVRHISGYCPVNHYLKVCPQNAWMIIFFFMYALIGWLINAYLLLKIESLIAKIYSKKISKIFIYLLIPILSLGLMLGLVDRWNSWEIFVHPFMILKSVWRYFSSWLYFKNWLAFCIGLYVSYFFVRRVIKKI